jgi:hypothetical protein
MLQVITSPHVIREACTVSHFGALTNNTYSATFTILKFYREGNSNGPPRFSLGYGFKAGDTGQFLLHSSNSPDAEPFWVIKLGPLNEYNQYDYAVRDKRQHILGNSNVLNNFRLSPIGCATRFS